MNYKIICDNKNIEFTNNYPALAFSEDINKNFYRVKNDIIEVDYCDLDNINESTDLKRKYKIIFIILQFIDECKLKTIESILKRENVIIAAMKSSDYLEDKNIMMLKGIDEKINVEALIDMFSNEDILIKVRNKNNTSSMVIGDEPLINPLANILRNMLKNFKHIDNYKDYIMYLYSSREFDLQETAYLEDLMKEYLYNSRRIEIKQINDSEIKDNVFYSILATR